MYAKILVAIDGSETSKRALRAAIQLACDHHAQLQALYVIDNPPVLSEAGYYDPTTLRAALIEEAERVCADASKAMQAASVASATELVEVELVGDDIAHQIEQGAKRYGADLVVMGTHGRRGMRRLLLGSVAERFLRISTYPILLIPAPHDD
ncbi:universal stress protein [Burkholderia sp. L27(2015)]|jgi:nucleotide-binding universal stress UspA family protein|uniref:universal stress protein n=1 Tax=Burkholderia sp. L27(2015) TaxID=1641858 RepID=UPI00131CFB4A|nr:universal stress protein [Burkholderia sp. L27(2015)]